MPLIRVEMFEGRSRAQKKAIVEDLTAAFCKAAGGKPEAVWVIIDDKNKDDWGIAGQLASDKYPD